MTYREIYESWVKEIGYTHENFTFETFKDFINRKPWMDQKIMSEVVMFVKGYCAGADSKKENEK